MNSGGGLQIFGSELRENSAVEGGAVANEMQGELKSSGNAYINNYAGDMGGALSNHSGVITLSGDQFSNNSSGSRGGAVSSAEDLSTTDIQDSSFSNNIISFFIYLIRFLPILAEKSLYFLSNAIFF